MNLIRKNAIKDILNSIPYAPDLYWRIRGRELSEGSRFSLEYLRRELPEITGQLKPFVESTGGGKKIFLFANLHYWIEHATLLGSALAGLGHHVTLGYLPYSDWQRPVHAFDLRRQNLYTRSVLAGAGPYVKPVSLLDIPPGKTKLPPDLEAAVREVSLFDSQYTLQVEQINQTEPVFLMRQERNHLAAVAAYSWLKKNPQDVVIVPNGTIQELGVVYRVARYLNIPATTYEFGEQRERIWLGQNSEIMRQNTDALWRSRKKQPINSEQRGRIGALYQAREGGQRWENFARLWQGVSPQGGETIRKQLNLDRRPVVMISTNVIGDSLTLGRQAFTNGMTEWLVRVLKYFAGRPETQVVIRVHPGEILTRGTSVVDIVKETLPELPAHMHLVGPREKINTYDIMQVTDLGMVYTTTVGMEMAMHGIPVLVTGLTHYRGRGFTIDPTSWDDYFRQLEKILKSPEKHRLSQAKIDLAWQYAYYFFFEFPRPFPWHLVRVWDDYRERPLQQVLSPEGLEKYGRTFEYLVDVPLDWEKIK
jgi:Capsule polysaccharide biosynthesis protein